MTINDRLIQIDYEADAMSGRRPSTADDKANEIWLFNERNRLVKLGYRHGFNAELAAIDRYR
jgi:hypothetical protein